MITQPLQARRLFQPRFCAAIPSILRRASLLLVAIAGLAARPAAGSLLVYEGFNYPSTVSGTTPDGDGDGKPDLQGLTGGSGFTGAWSEIRQNASAAPDYDYVRDGSLGFGQLKTSGNSIHSIQPNQRASFNLRSTNVIPATEGSTIWASFLMQKTVFTPGSSDNFNLVLENSDGNFVSFGTFTDTSFYGISGFGTGVNGEPDDGSNTFTNASTVSANNGNVAFLVVAIHFSSTQGSVEFFVNPTPGAATPTQANVTLNNFNAGSISRVQVYAEGRSSSTWNFDELRVGMTFADVAPVPEPASGVLLGLGGWLCAVRRRPLKRSLGV